MASVSGGDRLAQRLKEIAVRLGTNPEVKVGFLEGSTYPDGTSLPMVAAINEFGAPSRGQPPRPFIRNMIAAHRREWPKAAADLLATNDFDARKTLQLVGEGIKAQMQQSITDLLDPPLAPATVRRKGFDKPLINTGHMRNSIGVEVSDE